MPRVDSKALSGQLYQSQYTSGPYSSDSPASQQSDRQHSQPSSPTTSSALSAAAKKKHLCPTCDRAFTTSGHLARHSRVHTGERNHKCPFPGCETRCSRQDNLQQHYRIHLSPGSRRSSTRSAIARAMNPSSSPSKRNSVSSSEEQLSPPPMSPPALEPARLYTTHSPPPDTPPALEPATLPVAMHISDPVSSRSSSSPDNSYSPVNHHLLSMQSNSASLPGPQSYSYRSGTTTYQEQSQGAGFTYVHTTPIHSTSNSANNFSYSNAHGSFGNHSLPHMNSTAAVIHNTRHNSEPSISGMTSRHSISHISHPHSYSQGQSSSGGPPSPASSHSVSSHTSGPPTPTYPVFHGDGHAYHADSLMGNEAHSHPSMGMPSHILHSNSMYHHNGSQSQSSSGAITLSGGRFVDSPPPVLAPIQDERYIRREDRHSTQSHSSSPYIHHPQPLSSDYPYSQQIGLPTGGWKSENSLRKGLGALV
ncbi:hypothetical protein F5887DRAFT_1003430, partial [Amanita rubescens]